LIIAVDFDGVIFDGYDEIEGAVSTLLFAKQQGHKIILWTCCSERKLCGIVEWLKSKGLVFDSVNSCVFDSEWFSHPKVHADIYIDDKSFPPFSGWESFKKFLMSTVEQTEGGK
jgi:hypothetical protein